MAEQQPQDRSTSDQPATSGMLSFEERRALDIKALRSAVINAALPMTDEEINGHVKAALIQARRMLSS